MKGRKEGEEGGGGEGRAEGKERGAVADLGGVKGVQMHPPLAASNVFLRT